MAWLSRVNFISSDTLSFTDINNLGNDIRAWGDNVNGGGYTLSNVALSASSGTMATVTGGTGAASTLTIRSTSGTGTSDAIVFQTASQSEKMRITTGGNVGIGTASPVSPARLDLTKSITSNDLTTMRQLRIGVDTNSDYSGYLGYGNNSSGFYGLVLQGVHANIPSASFIALNPDGGNVGIGTASPATSAKLEIAGTTGALLVPRLTTTERNALTAVNGMIIYNTTDNQMQGRINGAWVAM